MILEARNNLFSFRFPNNFIPQEIREKYNPYINRLPNALDESIEFLNYTIQGINVPEIRQDSPIQMFSGINKNHRASIDVPNLFPKEISITLFLTEGYINYWMMYEIFLWYYRFDNYKQYIENFVLDLLNEDGQVLAKVELQEILFLGIDALALSHADNVQQFSTFTASFNFNRINIKLL